MCFSASASFIAAASLSGVGVAAVRQTTRRAEVPFAMIPLLFGIQQFTEGVLWLSLPIDEPLLTRSMTYTYSFFSHTLWPIYVPLALAALEPIRWRRRTLSAFQFVGIAVGLYLMYSIVRNPVTAQVVDSHIVYLSPHFFILTVMVFYFTATCASCLASSYPLLNVFGVLTFFSALAAYHFAASAFVSVWCFFAAVLSLMIYLHFSRSAVAARQTEPAPGQAG